MQISVIVPAFRRPALLREALASVQAQSWPLWEAVVVDADPDAPEAVALARSFGDPRVRAAPNPGRGRADACEAGLRAAAGEVVALLDDGDAWEDPRHLEAVVARLRLGPALVHRGGWIRREAPDGSAVLEPFDPPATPEVVRRGATPLGSSLAWPKELHCELGRFDRELGDLFVRDWVLRALAGGVPLHAIPGPGVRCRAHGGAPEARASGDPDRRSRLERLVAKHGPHALPEAPRAARGADVGLPRSA